MNWKLAKSRHTLEFLQGIAQRNPAVLLPSGDVRLPPARLSYPHLAKKAVDKETKEETAYEANLLFLPGADLMLLKQIRDKVLAEKFPKNPTGLGMRNPFRNQAEKVAPADGGANPTGSTQAGNVPGAPFIIPRSRKYRPHCYMLPIVNGVPTQCDEAKIEEVFYAGCWVLPTVNAYATFNGKNPGVFFGLQSLMKILDDDALGGDGGGAPNAAAYAGVQIDNTVDSSSLF